MTMHYHSDGKLHELDPANVYCHECRYSKSVGDCLLDDEVIAKSDLYDAVYAAFVTGMLDELLIAPMDGGDPAAELTDALWAEATNA